jgi:SHS2 domain-containing protein
MKKFEFLEHKADLKIKIFGKDKRWKATILFDI